MSLSTHGINISSIMTFSPGVNISWLLLCNLLNSRNIFPKLSPPSGLVSKIYCKITKVISNKK